VTIVRVDRDALAEWSRALDRLPPLADEMHAIASASASAPAGLSAAAVLHRTNLDGLRALADVVASFDRRMDQLRAATMVATASYSFVDGRAASIVDSSVR
jgi:hypothetical protein